MSHRFALSVLAAITAATAAAPLAAQTGPELVDPNGWLGGSPCVPEQPGHFCLAAFPDPFPIGGTDENPIYGGGQPTIAQQTLATLTGRSYFLGFLAQVHPHNLGGAELSVFWGGMPVTLDWVVVGGDEEEPVASASALLTAVGAGTTLTFQSMIVGTCSGPFCGDRGAITEISDASVRQDLAPTVGTPEPAAVALVGGGLALIGVGAARRRRVAPRRRPNGRA